MEVWSSLVLSTAQDMCALRGGSAMGFSRTQTWRVLSAYQRSFAYISSDTAEQLPRLGKAPGRGPVVLNIAPDMAEPQTTGATPAHGLASGANAAVLSQLSFHIVEARQY